MSPYSYSSLFSAVVMAFLGAYVFFRDTKSILNRLFMTLCMVMAFWAFTEYETRNAETAEKALFWLNGGLFWPVAMSLLLHFILEFAGRFSKGNKAYLLAVIHGPAVVFTLYNMLEPARTVVQVPWGWAYSLVSYTGYPLYLAIEYSWALTIAGYSLYLCIRYSLSAHTHQNRKMGKHMAIGLTVVILSGLFSEVLLPLLLKQPFLELTVSSCAVLAAFITYAILKYQMFPLSPVTAAENIIATISDPLFLVDLDLIIRTTNAAACHMLRYQTHELIGHPFSKVAPAPEGDNSDYLRMVKTGVVNDVETELLTSAGEKIPVSLSWSMTRGKDGALLGMTFIARNITERRRFQESLQQARDNLQTQVEDQTRELRVTNRMLREEIAERMRAEEQLAEDKEYLTVCLRSIADGVIVTDGDGKITLINRVAEKLTTWTTEEARGHALHEVFVLLDEKTRQPADMTFNNLLASGEGVRFSENAILLARDNTEYQIADSAAPIRHRSGKVRGMVVVFRDISEQRMQEELRFKSRRTESVNSLASGIAHDFNNALTTIMTSLFMARTHVQPDSDVHKLMVEAEQSAFKASSLTKQLLMLAKDSSPLRQRTRIKELLSEVIGYTLRDSSIDYELNAADILGEVEVDRAQVDQVISNILMNAVEAMPSGGHIRIRAEGRVVSEDKHLGLANGRYVVISIEDQGPGIAAEHIPRIFDPYFTTKQGHVGLGLPMAHAVMSKHNGAIDVGSAPDTGTVVTIYLPEAVEVGPEEGLAETTVAGAEDTAPVEIRILYMDDEEFLRRSAVRLLQHLGYEAVAARDGEDAVKAYREASENEEPFDLVILDLVVNNGMGGIETLRELRKSDPHVRAILTTGYGAESIPEDYRQQGFLALLPKPFAIEELEETLRACLREQR